MNRRAVVGLLAGNLQILSNANSGTAFSSVRTAIELRDNVSIERWVRVIVWSIGNRINMYLDRGILINIEH